MEVESEKVEVGGGEGLADGVGGVAGLDGEAELAVQDAGGGVDVGVGVNAGREPEQDGLHDAAPGGDVVEQVEFVEAVHDDASAADFEGVFELLGGLVVAVEIDAGHVGAGGYGHGEFATGDDVESESFFGDYLRNAGVDECLGCVEYAAVRVAGAEGVNELAAHAAQGGVVEDEQGGCRTRRRAQRCRSRLW